MEGRAVLRCDVGYDVGTQGTKTCRLAAQSLSQPPNKVPLPLVGSFSRACRQHSDRESPL